MMHGWLRLFRWAGNFFGLIYLILISAYQRGLAVSKIERRNQNQWREWSGGVERGGAECFSFKLSQFQDGFRKYDNLINCKKCDPFSID